MLTFNLAFVSLISVDRGLLLLSVLVEVVRVLALETCVDKLGRQYRASQSSERLTLLTSSRLEESTEHRLGV